MGEIVKQNGKEISKEVIDLIRKTVAKDANDLELQLFLHIAKEYDLDPILKEIVFMKRKVWNEYKQSYDEVPTMMVSRDGLLAIAHKSGHFDGIKTETILDDKGNIKGARCIVYNNACTHPIESEVLFSEYCVYRKDKTGKTVPQALWATKPATMIRKVAESQALRRAFNVKGVYSQEELEAEIQKDTKTELEYMGDALAITEKVHASSENYDVWTQDTKTKILDDLLACENVQQLNHLKKQYEADIGRFMDEDRSYIQVEIDETFRRLVQESEPELQPDGSVIDRNTGQEVELEPGTQGKAKSAPKKASSELFTDLEAQEAYGKEFLPVAIKEIDACPTKAALDVWKNKNAEKRMKLMKEHKEYLDAFLKNAYGKKAGLK